MKEVDAMLKSIHRRFKKLEQMIELRNRQISECAQTLCQLCPERGNENNCNGCKWKTFREGDAD